jgi:hypothetical protein
VQLPLKLRDLLYDYGPHNAQLDLDMLVTKQGPDVIRAAQSAQEIREICSWQYVVVWWTMSVTVVVEL